MAVLRALLGVVVVVVVIRVAVVVLAALLAQGCAHPGAWGFAYETLEVQSFSHLADDGGHGKPGADRPRGGLAGRYYPDAVERAHSSEPDGCACYASCGCPDTSFLRPASTRLGR